ncbi:helix-turn-helix domain-containing protein [Ramlibacter ginsenosidimutans]|uniref:Helix-turn-helix domain-containing protein n=2 Tax=Ramlibacter ginsenosidimutans TaxID=502333 RepID=A0A934WN22_9BURK|nr:helix-turn-helix domain-containing protein [Ramlibacter ginsenosidimutans]
MTAETEAPCGQHRRGSRSVEGHDVPSAEHARIRLAQCSPLHVRESCLAGGLSQQDLEALDRLTFSRRRAHLGEPLYEAGQAFGQLYAVGSGTFKSCVTLADGRQQVTGFHLPGELLGLDGVGTGTYASGAIALEDSEVCVIPYANLRDASSAGAEVQGAIARLMSREIVRAHSLMLMLGSMNAEERLAAFLLSFSSRMKARGFSPTEFHLRMSREEIGSFLGMKLETVSRTFSSLVQKRLLDVNKRHVRIVDLQQLQSALAR